ARPRADLHLGKAVCTARCRSDGFDWVNRCASVFRESACRLWKVAAGWRCDGVAEVRELRCCGFGRIAYYDGDLEASPGGTLLAQGRPSLRRAVDPQLAYEHFEHVLQARAEPWPANRKVKVAHPGRVVFMCTASSACRAPADVAHDVRDSVAVRVHL